jgi:hypothetical protein
MTALSGQSGSHWPLARVIAKVVAGLLLAVLAVALLDAHYAHMVWGGSRSGSLSPQSPLLMQCLYPWSCGAPGSTALPLLLGISVATLTGWLALQRRRRRAHAQADGK